jgi:hypothetical protein
MHAVQSLAKPQSITIDVRGDEEEEEGAMPKIDVGNSPHSRGAPSMRGGQKATEAISQVGDAENSCGGSRQNAPLDQTENQTKNLDSTSPRQSIVRTSLNLLRESKKNWHTDPISMVHSDISSIFSSGDLK